MTVTPYDAARELLDRRKGRRSIFDYIRYTSKKYKESLFSELVCAAIDKFIDDVQAGKRPVLILQAPPQHGKSEIVSRKLPAYIMGRFPDWYIGAASYNSDLATAMAQDVRRNLASPEHQRLFPATSEKQKFSRNTMGEFNSPGGSGGYIGDGVGGGFTGRPITIFIVDDPIKDQKEALSETTKEGLWNWYQSVLTTRLAENSGQIIMATSWAEDDLPARIYAQFKGDPRLTYLGFPAINSPDEAGYNPALPEGALVPALHSLEQLKEIKATLSDYWWSALYQQSAKALGGNVFREEFVQYYLPKDLPERFDKVITSWDCTFKDTDGTDYVSGQTWGKRGANSYLLAHRYDRMSFTRTLKEVIAEHNAQPRARTILIEDKANGPAVIDTLNAHMPAGYRLIAVEPDGSKLARAHAVTSYWEARNIWLPHPSIAPWIVAFVAELTRFPAAAHDDRVDAMTQALRHLYPLIGRLKISEDVLAAVMR